MSSIRPHIHRPRYGEITQGTIFCCAQATRYESCEVYGLAITARCDVAQRKYPILNYLPIIDLNEWLRRDGLDILVEQELNEQTGKLGALLRQANISPSLPDAVPLTRIADTHFPEGSGNKAQKNAAKSFREHVALIEDFKKVVGGGDAAAQFEWLRINRPKQIESLINRLSRHQVLGHYLFEEIWPEDGKKSGYVCLLREVATLPRNVAEELGRGLSCDRYQELCSQLKASTGLSIAREELAMPISLVGSPTIEHVLQAFSNLFGRIGIADPQAEVIGNIVEKCLSKEIGGPK